MPQTAHWHKWAFILALFVLGTLAFKMGEALLSPRDLRHPASQSGGLDLSEHEGKEFFMLARLRMAEGLHLRVEDRLIRLRTGHFLGPRTPVSVCTTYPQVEFEFGSSDQAISGEPVLLSLIGECEADRTGEHTEWLEVSIDKIKSGKISDGELRVFGKRVVRVKLSNTGDDWPREWSLRSVRFFSDLGEIRVEGEELYRLRGQATSMRW